MCGKAGHADPLNGWCCSNPGPTSTHKHVWISDICHKQIHGRKQISIRCNRIEHWVHLRCAGICQELYIYLDLSSTQIIRTHNSHRHNTTPPLQTLVQAPTHSPHTPPTPPQPKHTSTIPCSHRIGKAQTQSSHPLTTLSTHAAPSQTHTHTPSTPFIPRTTLIHSTSAALDTIPEPRVSPTCPALTTTTPHPSSTYALPSPSHSHTLSSYTHATQTTVHASQSQQPPHPHRVPRQPHKQTKDDHMTTDTTHGHRPSSKSERNVIILQVNINGIKNNLEELKLLIHDTHADIITIHETKLTPKANTPNVHNFTSVRADKLHKAGGGLITLIRDNITFTTTDIPSTINTHYTELQMVKVHNTKHVTIANIYIPRRGSTTTHYKTADTDIQHCIQYITNIPPSVVTGDVNAYSTLCHWYTDDHRGQLIADVICNSDHITLNTNTPTRVPNTALQQTSSPCITKVSNTLYNRTSWTTQHALSSDHLPIITTIIIRHDYRLQQNRREFTNYKKAD